MLILARIIVKTVSDKKYKNAKTYIIRNGHFNGRVHSTEQMSCMVMRNFARYLMNIAMCVKREDFDEMMRQLTNEIYRAASDETCDLINEAHARKKSQKGTLDA